MDFFNFDILIESRISRLLQNTNQIRRGVRDIRVLESFTPGQDEVSVPPLPPPPSGVRPREHVPAGGRAVSPGAGRRRSGPNHGNTGIDNDN